MIKRVVIAGCRYYNNYQEAKEYINHCICRIQNKHTLIFVCVGCKGADFLGEKYAVEHGFQLEKYYADWKHYGKSAGPKRNKIMAEIGDYFICFWDGKSKGTKSMINYILETGKPTKIKRI